ncbi:MAG TPA: undecaprenyl-diphosphatase UppP [Vicinamibacterales bacterium]|nr:undecaprenyl-diphosphatase UppP [Vicinamibacterales bacterium]
MRYVEAALLGVIQGLTEFLPISSSAHLILARALFGWDAGQFGLAFDVACHVGTLLAIVAYFRVDLMRMLAAAPGIVSPRAEGSARLAQLIAIGTTPIVIVGLVLRPHEDALRTPSVAAAMLFAGGLVLLVADRVGRCNRGSDALGFGEAFALGWAQAAALIPGVSRSGGTIMLGLFLGLRRDAAARFGFLLGVPAIVAAAVYEGLHLRGTPFNVETAQLFAVGMGVSALVGYLTIAFFLRFLVSHSLAVFAWYRLVVATLAAVWLVF